MTSHPYLQTNAFVRAHVPNFGDQERQWAVLNAQRAALRLTLGHGWVEEKVLERQFPDGYVEYLHVLSRPHPTPPKPTLIEKIKGMAKPVRPASPSRAEVGQSVGKKPSSGR